MTDTPDDITAILDSADLVQREARDVILKLREQTTWRTIESAPKVVSPDAEILVWDDHCIWTAWWNGMCWLAEESVVITPTHWMPLPQPPEAKR